MNDYMNFEEIINYCASEEGFSLLKALEKLMNSLMLMEREKVLKAKPYERNENRQGYANGFKPKTYNTQLGAVALKIPQTRGVEFYPSILEKGQRSEKALMASLAEMYVNGVSTRKVKTIVETFCGIEISSTQVSRATAELDKIIEPWKNRDLSKEAYAFLYLDATYENVRRNGIVESTAILTALGVDSKGKRRVLGVSVEISEAEAHWRHFLESLASRGLYGLKLIISDAHTGLQKARQAVFPSVPWQRCQFHLQQNAHAYVRQDQRKEVGAKLRSVFQASDRDEADHYLKAAISFYEKSNPRLSQWIEENVIEGLTCFSFPENIRKHIRTTNLVERNNREIKRRTKVATLFPSTTSLERLVAAVLIEIDEAWLGENFYMNLNIKEVP